VSIVTTGCVGPSVSRPTYNANVCTNVWPTSTVRFLSQKITQLHGNYCIGYCANPQAQRRRLELTRKNLMASKCEIGY